MYQQAYKFYQSRYNVQADHSCHQVWNIWTFISVALPLWALHLTFLSLKFSALDGFCCVKHKSSYLAKYQAVSLKKRVDTHMCLYV
jgi:hypothetical protein